MNVDRKEGREFKKERLPKSQRANLGDCIVSNREKVRERERERERERGCLCE